MTSKASWQVLFAEDAWEASWQEYFWLRMIFVEGIILGETFHCRGMHFAEGNHPWESFFLQRDAFHRRKSSLEELFTAEGCISRKEIIPERAFLCRGMHFAEGNHPWESFSLQRDAFRRRKSSLEELFTAEGCISQKEIIPGRAFFC